MNIYENHQNRDLKIEKHSRPSKPSKIIKKMKVEQKYKNRFFHFFFINLSNAPQSGDPATALAQKKAPKIEQTAYELRRQNDPKSQPKSSKNQSKIDQKSSKNHPWGRLGAAWGRLGSSWGLGTVFVASWSHLRAVPGASWGVQEASWRRLGGVLGASCVDLGPSWGVL